HPVPEIEVEPEVGRDVSAYDEIDRYELPQMPTGIGEWMRRGSCRTPDAPTWMFFPGRGDHRTVDAAKAVCATCPVQAECLDAALANDEPGIWGGTTARD